KRSNLLIASWRRLFELDGLLYLGSEIDTEICWNSTYLMLIKSLKIRIQVNILIAQNPDDFNDLIFTNNNWANIYSWISEKIDENINNVDIEDINDIDYEMDCE
ncbi:1576_t:CDS:2, partial [Scutellospora calospora]